MPAICTVVSFNCAKRLQDVSNIQQVLTEPLNVLRNPEFLVFCLQEVAPIMESSLGWTSEWLDPFKKAVPDAYRFVGQSVSGACAVLVFSVSFDTFSSTQYDVTSFGMFWSSLKGAALFSLNLPQQRGKLTFISAHLAANQGQKAQRNQDFNYMVKDLNLEQLEGQVIIAGDLNYRTSDGTFATDELRSEMAAKSVGKGFTEGDVEFGPTYKFIPGTNELNKGERIPSYCDRILHRKLQNVRIIRYGSVMIESLDSDHKPVYAVLSSPTETMKKDDKWQSIEQQASMDGEPTSPEYMSYSHVNSLANLLSPRDVPRTTNISPPLPRLLRKSNNTFASYRTAACNTLIGLVTFAVTRRQGQLGMGVLLILLIMTRF